MSLVERIRSLAKEKGTTIKALERELGIGNGTIRGWDQASPSAIKLLSVAKFLDTSVDFLLTGEIIYPKQYDKIIKMYLKLPQSDKIRVEEYMNFVNEYQEIHTRPAAYDNNIIREKSTYYSTPTKHPIPILGYVAAGVPIHSENVPMGSIDISSDQSIDYALIAKGQSMEPVIHDGDYIFVQKTSTLEIGEIGIFYIDGEVTCKKFYVHSEFIELKSLNPEYPIIKIPSSVSDFLIQGRVLLTQSQKARL